MTTTGTTTVSTTGGFQGADVDGLDKLSADFTQAANVCNEVKTACEIIVAVASFFGPFGAGFIAYLKGTVIPWLTKIGQALTAMSKVLSLHSQAQKDTSSSATSLPSYTSPGNFPTTDTNNLPDLSSLVSGLSSFLGGTAAASPASTVTAPPAIGGSVATATPGTVATTAPASPNQLPTDGSSSPNGTTSTGGDTTGGDTIGVLSVPVRISPDGTITGLFQTPSATPATTPTQFTDAPTPTIAQPIDSTPLTAQPLTTKPTTPALTAARSALTGGGGSGGGSGGGYGGGGSLGGGYGGGSDTGSDVGSTFTPTVAATTPTLGGSHALLTSARTDATPNLAGGAGGAGSHDGLFTGLGTATGIGAGGAALARAVLSEARQRGDGSMLGAVPLPFDAGADTSAQAQIFNGSLG